MQIETLKIAGFRCFGPDPVQIGFQKPLTAFVGNNGSGKTAIFQALSRLFGVTAAQRTIKKSDFHVAADEVQIESGASLFIECVLAFPEDNNGDNDDGTIPEVFHQMTAAGEGEALKVRIRMEATWEDDLTPEGTVSQEIKWVRALNEEFEWEEAPKLRPSDRSLIQLIYVPANRNAADQVTNLLKGRLWRAAEWSDELEQAAADGSNQVQAQFDNEVPAQFITERLEGRWEQVHQGDTDSRPMLRLVENRLDDLLKRAEFVFIPDEAQQARRLDELSDGQRSLFHIALTAAVLEMERDALDADDENSAFDQDKLKRTYLTLLAIEEPENSLSPFFLSRIMVLAREIGAMSGAQVFVSSHSASILSRIDPEEVRYVRHTAAERTSSVRALTLPPDGDDARTFVRLAVRSFPELYFARAVVLAEGESEAVVIPRLAEAMTVPLDRSFVPIVPLGGRFVRHFWRLLTDLNIPYVTLLDLDLGRAHGGANAFAQLWENWPPSGMICHTIRQFRTGI